MNTCEVMQDLHNGLVEEAEHLELKIKEVMYVHIFSEFTCTHVHIACVHVFTCKYMYMASYIVFACHDMYKVHTCTCRSGYILHVLHFYTTCTCTCTCMYEVHLFIILYRSCNPEVNMGTLY